MPNRKNKHHAKVVDTAIRIANYGRPGDAAVLCQAHEVPFDVAHRIVLKPKARRKSHKQSNQE